MQLSDLLLATNNLLDEDGVRRSETTLTTSLNGGYWVTAILTQCCERSQSIRAVSESLVTTLPVDFYTAVSVYYNNTRLFPIRLVDLDDLDPDWMSTDASTPIYYTTVGALTQSPQLWLYPPPDSVGTIRLTYASVPSRMTHGSDTPRFPVEHHYTLVWWAYAWEMLKERSPILANKSFQTYARYMEDLANLQQYVYRRTPDRDWMSPPLDAEAVRRKLVSLEQTLVKPAVTIEPQVLQQ